MRKTIFLILQMVVPPLPRPLVPLVPLVPKLCLGTQVAKLCLASGTGPGREAELRDLRTQAELYALPTTIRATILEGPSDSP